MSQRPQQTASAPQGSQTQTQAQPAPSPDTNTPAPRVLRLRGQHTTNGRSVQWAEGVVDNEALGRKSSKVCCIYHRPKAVGESSDESSSSSSDDSSDSDSEPGRKGDADSKDHSCGHNHKRGRRSKKDGKQKRPPSPNAYEKVPKQKPRADVGSSKS
ncbi:phosphatase inhibitor-domain-containing protein [Stachybotrys elegans]|uniref:Type 1 phosphatases regulator n=1 Tax=Stachybotrys elegans TaxID=80388 RepID=A0A8K0WSS7_9HYPO|nr:phosphatase inhibitor-domain-containing protein [Stachybotrys elegans]